MKHLVWVLLITAAACNSPKEDNQPDQPGQAVPKTESDDAKITGCYMQVLQRDTLAAQLTENGNEISGKLMFDNYEKDGSTGTVKGIREGDILKLTYTFQSEGMQSVMDVYFKKDGSNLVRGVGEMETRGDTAYFTSPSEIQYPSNGSMHKVECDKINWKK